MKFVVRKIDRKARWARSEALLGTDDLHPDILSEVRTSKKTLSFYRVETREEAETVLVAVGVGTDKPDDLDGLVFTWDEFNDLLTKQGLAFKETKGKSALARYNDLHIDVEVPSAKALIALTRHLVEKIDPTIHVRRVSQAVLVKEVRRFILEGLMDKASFDKREKWKTALG